MTRILRKRETRFLAGLALSMAVLTLVFHFLESRLLPPSTPGLVISEFMADNDSLFIDDFREPSDWIEIHNRSDHAINLSGYCLTDDHALPLKWRFPRMLLPAGKRLVVFASGRNRTDPRFPLHTNFKLDAAGEYLALIKPDGMNPSSEYLPKYPAQQSNVSFGWESGTDGRSWLTDSQVPLAFPTPAEPNSNRFLGFAPTVRFSHEHGILEAPIEVSLQCDDTAVDIYYSTNGKDPAEERQHLYTQPIRINKTTTLRAAAVLKGYRSPVSQAKTYLFLEDVLRQSPHGETPPGFPEHWGANRVDYGMDPEIVEDPRYGDLLKDALKALPSFSLVMDPDHLFDSAIGIYANPESAGRDWERPASLELIHPGNRKGFSSTCGIRIRGGFSRSTGNPKHAFRVFFRKDYGQDRLEYPLFGEKAAPSHENFDLRTFQNYSWSFQGDARGVFIRDVFSRDTQLAMGHPGARGDYYHLYVNGHYWGIYNSCERPKASYGANYLGGEKEEYDVIKIIGRGQGGDDEKDPENVGGFQGGFGRGFMSAYRIFATDGSMAAWEALYEIAAKGLESDAAYQRLLGNHPDGTINPDYPVYLDPINLIDYMLVILYGGNLDAPIMMMGNGPNNFFALRNRNKREGFKFFAWDAEHTLLDVYENRIGPFDTGRELGTSNPQWLWEKCLENKEFRSLAADRIQKHFFNDGILTVESCIQRFKRRVGELELAVVAESARWGDSLEGGGGGRRFRSRGANRTDFPLNRDDHWRPEVNRLLKDYFPHRTQIVLDQLWSIGLVPDPSPPEEIPGDEGSRFRFSETLKYDRDEDGILDESERETMRKDRMSSTRMPSRRGGFGPPPGFRPPPGFGPPRGFGPPPDLGDRFGPRPRVLEVPRELFERFDADNDGNLDEREIEALKTDLMNRMRQQAPLPD